MLYQIRRQGGPFSTPSIGPLITTMIQGLISDGVWSKLDRLWIFAQDTQANALTDLVVGALAQNNGATFAPFTGFKGNGTSAYIDTGFNPATASGNYVQNSAHLSAYDRTPSGDAHVAIGYENDSNGTTSIIEAATTAFNGLINGAIAITWTGTQGPGMFVISRNGSATQATLYRNGASSGLLNTNSHTVESGNVYVLATHVVAPSSFAGGWTSDQIAAASIGGGLSDTDAANLSTRINTYMTAIGANVY